MSEASDRYASGAQSAIRQGGTGINQTTSALREQTVRSSAPLTKDINHISKSSQQFYAKDLDQAYMAGARSGAGTPTYVADHDDHGWLKDKKKEGTRDIKNAEQLAKRDSRRLGQQARKGELGTGPRDRVRGARYKDGRFVKMDAYADMKVTTDASLAYNRGYVKGAASVGHEWFEIIDSPDCGLNGHDDHQKARGLIVSADQAMSIGISHPFCGRTFQKKPVGFKPKDHVQRKAKALGRALIEANIKAAQLNMAVGATALVSQNKMVRRSIENGMRGDPVFAPLRAELKQLLHDFNHRNADVNVIDIKTGRAIRENWTEAQMIDLVNSHQQLIADGQQIPMFVRRALGVRDVVPKYLTAVGEGMHNFGVFASRNIQAAMSVVDLDNLSRLNRDVQQALWDWVGPREFNGRFARFSLPNTGGLGRRPRIRFLPDNDEVKSTITYTKKRGLVPNLRVNPNGIIRAGFQYDPDSGLLFPNMSAVPKGPFHIKTKINRSGGFFIKEDLSNMARAKQFATQHGIPHESLIPGTRVGSGAVTSLSVEVRLVARTGRNLLSISEPGIAFRLNLRRLKISSLSDVVGLSLDDFKSLGLRDVEAIRLVANLNLRGLGPFDISRILGLPIGDARMIQELGWKEVFHQVAEAKADSLAEKWRVISGLANGTLKVDKNIILQNLQIQTYPYFTQTIREVRASLGYIPNVESGGLIKGLPDIYAGLRHDAPIHKLITRLDEHLHDVAEEIYAVLNSDTPIRKAIVLVRDAQLRALNFLGYRPLRYLRYNIGHLLRPLMTGSVRPYLEVVGADAELDVATKFWKKIPWFQRRGGLSDALLDEFGEMRLGPGPRQGTPWGTGKHSLYSQYRSRMDIGRYDPIQDSRQIFLRNDQWDSINEGMQAAGEQIVEEHGFWRAFTDDEMRRVTPFFQFLDEISEFGPQVKWGVFEPTESLRTTFAYYKYMGPDAGQFIMINADMLNNPAEYRRWMDDLREVGHTSNRIRGMENPAIWTLTHEYGHATFEAHTILGRSPDEVQKFLDHWMNSVVQDLGPDFDHVSVVDPGSGVSYSLSQIMKSTRVGTKSFTEHLARADDIFRRSYLDGTNQISPNDWMHNRHEAFTALVKDELSDLVLVLADWVGQQVSGYAVENFHELMAETFMYYYLEDDPSTYTVLMGRLFDSLNRKGIFP